MWNEKILNAYEKDKLQYLTSKEKEHYFQDKLRQIRKFDTHGVLDHEDWFFRVVVLDYIVQEMDRLVSWFKNCSWDDFDTVYRIMRKLRMLKLDVDSIWNDETFDINKTNLFRITDDEVKEFKKIDELLVGNTLYELFRSQLKLPTIVDEEEEVEKDENKVENDEIK